MVREAVVGLVAVFLGLSSSAMAAEEMWIARCNDLEFHYGPKGGKAEVFMRTTDGLFLISRGDVVYDTDIARGAVLQGAPVFDNPSVTQVRINRSRGIVYVVFRSSQAKKTHDGIFCHTKVTLTPP